MPSAGTTGALWKSQPVDTVGSCDEDGCCPQAELEGTPVASESQRDSVQRTEAAWPCEGAHWPRPKGFQGVRNRTGDAFLRIISLLEFQARNFSLLRRAASGSIP